LDNEEDYQIRLQDFIYAQEKRRDLYGDVSPWGILGLYEHLAAIRTDIEWAENVVWGRKHGKKCVFIILVCLFSSLHLSCEAIALPTYSQANSFISVFMHKISIQRCISWRDFDDEKREALTDHSLPPSFSSSVQ